MIQRAIRFPGPVLVLAGILVTGVADVATAQSDYYFRHPELMNPPATAEPAPNGDWNLDTNGTANDGGSYWWDPEFLANFIPDFSFGDGERARIENGGTAYVQTDGGIYPGQIIIGSENSGTLEVRDGGVMHSMQGAMTNGNITVGNATGSSGPHGTLRVLPGGTLTAQSNIISGFGNPANTISVGGLAGSTATLTAASAQLNALTQVFPNADFSVTGALNFGNQGNSNYLVEVTGNGVSGMIDVGATATLNGALTLNFNGYSPMVGHSWTVLEAGAVVGQFSSINSNATLPFNQNFVASRVPVSGDRTQLNVGIEEVLVLEVDRDTGMVTLTHPGSDPIPMDGYFIGSDAGALDPDARMSVNGQASLGTDWIDTAATPNNVGELKPTSDGTVPAGTLNVQLGPIFNAFAGEFGQDNEDLQFGYRRSDGTQSTGVVRFTGTRVNTLLLQVDPTGVGDAFLRNTSNATVQIDAYDILSETGRLDPDAWNSLDEQGADSDAWLEILNKDANQIGEVNTLGFTTLGPGASRNLGPLYLGGEQDLTFSFLLMGEQEGTAGKVVYEAFIPAEVPGDYNLDGVVNAADYVVWRNHVGTAFALPNRDPNLNGNIGQADYDFWVANFGNTSGVGTLAQAVPEPAAAGLWLAALMAATGMGWRRAENHRVPTA